MIGILKFGLARGLTYLAMLTEHRRAESIAAYGWPLRYRGAPRGYEGGKGTAVAAEIEIRLHVLNLTRSQTGIFRTILFESSARAPADNLQPSPARRDSLDGLGVETLGELARRLSAEIGDLVDRARTIELTCAIVRRFESVGVNVDRNRNPKRKQPGLATGLLLQFVATDRD